MRPPVVSFTPYPIAVLLLTGRTSIPDQFSEARSGLDPFWRTSKMWGVAPERMSRRRSESSGKRRSFTLEFKAEVVELCQAGDRSIGQVCRDLGLTETAVRRWVMQAEIDVGERAGLSTEERVELARLRKGNHILRQERDILKRATAFFAKETR